MQLKFCLNPAAISIWENVLEITICSVIPILVKPGKKG